MPFRISPEPLRLCRTDDTQENDERVIRLGPAICEFFRAIIELYHTDERVRLLLDKGKPECYKNRATETYLFLRPDLILTPEGFFVCEIETSPFGLGIAEMLNRAYSDCGFDTIVARERFQEYVQEHTTPNGVIAYSEKVIANAGQLHYLADRIFSGKERKWVAKKIDESFSREPDTLYRAFYLYEAIVDKNVQKIVERNAHFIPSLTPQFEEKALLTFIWDKRFEPHFRAQLGSATFNFLREILPPAWIVGEEQHFAPGLPGGINSTADIASISQSKRKWVLKQSGFGEHSSWGEGVTFLHKVTRPVLEAKLQEACSSQDLLYICQEFRDGVKRPTSYYAENGDVLWMNARVRLCMYYANMGVNVGDIIAAWATCCDDGPFVHGKANSVNTAVVV